MANPEELLDTTASLGKLVLVWYSESWSIRNHTERYSTMIKWSSHRDPNSLFMYLNRDGKKADKGIFKTHNERIKKTNLENVGRNFWKSKSPNKNVLSSTESGKVTS